MIKYNFIIAWRNMLRNRFPAFLNILGLALGVAASLFIFLYVFYESGYDKFHQNADRIYRIGLHGKMGETEFTQTYTTPMLSRELVNYFPEIKTATRVYNSEPLFMSLKKNGKLLKKHEESRLFAVDSTFVEIFSFPVIHGNIEKALAKPGTVILTRSSAEKYFGTGWQHEDIMNQLLSININGNEADLSVKGIIEDVPDQSHMHFDFLISIENLHFKTHDNWYNNYFHTYILLEKGASAEKLEATLPEIYRKNMGGDQFDQWLSEGNRWESFLTPLTDIHLSPEISGELESHGNRKYLSIFTLAGIFIILIACVNFVNLSTAYAVNRMKEIGIRKVLGSPKKQIIFQNLLETFLICLFVFIIGFFIVDVLSPYFQNFTGKPVSITSLLNIQFMVIALSVLVTITLLSGIYPAFYLSSFNPVNILRKKSSGSGENLFFRNTLVVFQFMIAIIMIIGTFVVVRQLNYIQDKNLGFKKENIVVINNAWAVNDNHEQFKNQLNQENSVISTSFSTSIPGKGLGNVQFRPEGFEKNVILNLVFADDKFKETYDLELAEGRFFSASVASDSFSVIINEATARNLGWEDPLGKNIKLYGRTGRDFTVAGVVKDFHYQSLHNDIKPLVIVPGFYERAWNDTFVSVKINSRNIRETLSMIEKYWYKFSSDAPFEYFFFDQAYDHLYKNEALTSKVFSLFAGLNIIISILGLIGLVSYNLHKRSKEISIRKIFGATGRQIVIFLTSDISKRILLAFILAVPIGWWMMNEWLQSFAYKANLSGWTFLIAGLLTLSIALLSISYQTIKATLSNPVDALRDE